MILQDCCPANPKKREYAKIRSPYCPEMRQGDGISFVTVLFLFAVAQCLSCVFGNAFVRQSCFCTHHTIVCNSGTETPNFCFGEGTAMRHY